MSLHEAVLAVRLATWNLEHFWHEADKPLLIRKNGDATRLRDERLLMRTRAAVQSLEADILCLQEIGGVSDLEFLCPDAQHVAERRLDPHAAPRARFHGIGFALNPALGAQILPEIPLGEADGSDDYARNGLVIRIPGWGLIVGLHLKAGCRDKLRLDKRAPCRILGAQVHILAEWLAGQDQPVTLMGDFNRVLGQPRDTVLKALQAAAPDLRLAPLTYRQVDHILTPKSWHLRPAGPKGLNGYSDHRPVCFDVA